ncbi:toll/interleukin-1 receptor domain-containing protein [Enterococcus avium]|uniref:toll/interleukin-1 receptor domain-containing protein n=1 Tax=Enterococcus avium TaxID=33945 RepID=UPI002891FF8E|nr:toll/interleukin-1 receptor domain-containing protein [Enterococcus avium]MDT2477443.1 toll/interleukin-1 receptor domain-containing protein [Enterococcus avium]
MERRIFISYAWEKEKTADRKIKSFTQWLAIYLKKWGFEVLLDVYENHPGTKLNEFMVNGINSSRFVICICTETYINKIKDPKTGVFNEVTLLKEKSNSPFIIPIIEKGKFENLPDFFEGKFVSELLLDTPYSQENQNPIFELITTLRDELLSIKNVDTESRIDSYYNDVEKFKFFSDAVNLMSFEGQAEQTVTFQYLINGGDFKIGIPPMEFVTHWSTAGSESIHSYNKVQKMLRIHNFKEFESINMPSDIKEEWLIPIKWSTTLKVGDGVVWINNKNYVAVGKILDINLNSNDEYRSTVTLGYKVLNPIEVSDDFIEHTELEEIK